MMDLDEMLKEHQRWLDKAHKSLTAAGAGAPAELTQSRIDQLHARIAELERQKEREVRRYDAAIAELQAELAVASPASQANDETQESEKKPSKKARPRRARNDALKLAVGSKRPRHGIIRDAAMVQVPAAAGGPFQIFAFSTRVASMPGRFFWTIGTRNSIVSSPMILFSACVVARLGERLSKP